MLRAFSLVARSYGDVLNSRCFANQFDYVCMGLQVLMSWQLADALLNADALQMLFGLHPSAVHVCSCMFM